MPKQEGPTDPLLYNRIKEQVKASVNRWPSAYASGMVVKLYKDKMLELNKQPYHPPAKKDSSIKGLTRWFAEKWIDIKTNKECGSVRSSTYYPTCRPSRKIAPATPVTANELTSRDKYGMVQQKQEARKETVLYDQTQRKRLPYK